MESAAARVCREAGGRVASNLLVRNMDVGVPHAGDNRRLEVVVDGLPLFSGRQLAVDTTLGEVQQTAMEWHSQKLDGSRNEPTLNSLDLAPCHNS